MPDCSYIRDYSIRPSHGSWEVTIQTATGLHYVTFNAILSNTFQDVRLISAVKSDNYPSLRTTRFSIPQESTDENALKEFLRILQWTVTISDDADESHALRFHRIPNPLGATTRSKMGSLVVQAKLYPRSGTESATLAIANRMKNWIARHPRYRNADVMVPAPSGNPRATNVLPEFIAKRLCDSFNSQLVKCEKIKSTKEQKILTEELRELPPPERLPILKDNVASKFRVNTDLRNKTVLILDDLYGSGATLQELGMACRKAGASCILSLTATKNITFSDGLVQEDWNKIYEMYQKARQLDDE